MLDGLQAFSAFTQFALRGKCSQETRSRELRGSGGAAGVLPRAPWPRRLPSVSTCDNGDFVQGFPRWPERGWKCWGYVVS